jgi:hypothetical protein
MNIKRVVLPILASFTIWCGSARAQTTQADQKKAAGWTLVDSVHFMPYLTMSANFHSGEAFPKSATGIGYGFGLAFDLTKDGQKLGAYFDFAYQDMRASAIEGGCMNQLVTDTLLSTVKASHYFQYVSLETFLKIQGEKSNGYLLIGASFGFAVLEETFYQGLYRTSVADWKGTDFGNPFRLDLRLGLGIVLAKFGTHKLILEARAGYPVTAAISNYVNVCTGGGVAGNWRIITLQGNLGYRF